MLLIGSGENLAFLVLVAGSHRLYELLSIELFVIDLTIKGSLAATKYFLT